MVKSVIGINLGLTRNGVELMDGGAALVVDGRPVTAISEERLSRKRYDGNFDLSLKYCLAANRLAIEDIDLFAFSICCDSLPTKAYTQKILKKYDIAIPDDKILIVPSHHLSHAYSVYYSSGFEKSLIFVLDNEGNMLDGNSGDYYNNALERTSIYLAKGNSFSLVGRFHDSPNSHCFGSIYNAFTRTIGYSSYQEAGKTMALAPYGKGQLDNVRLFGEAYIPLIKGNKGILKNVFDIETLFYQETGRELARSDDLHHPTQDQKELAWLVQRELERASMSLVEEYLRKYNVENVCLAGGVGLNCVNNYKLIKGLGLHNFFVQPACGDTGQCLGNAYYGYWQFNKEKKNPYRMRNAYLGRSYSKIEINASLDKYKSEIEIVGDTVLGKIADLLMDGRVLGVFMGGCEFGPRALGHRSMIIDPSNKEAKEKLDEIKHREYYRPYAPSILAEHVGDFFDNTHNDPFMLVATQVKQEKQKQVPFIVHVDGSSRIQSVEKEQSPLYYQIIEAFYRKSGIPMVLNTSFNISGEPIVETPEDAIKTFLKTRLDYLILENMLLRKRVISSNY